KLVDEAISRWNASLPEVEQIPEQILVAASQLEPAKVNDLLRWFEEEVEIPRRRYGDILAADEPEFLAEWLTHRIEWIDAHIAELRPPREPLPMIPRRPRDRDN